MSVVQYPIRHTHISGDASMGIVQEYRDGNAIIRVSNKYYANKTPEQDKIDKERLKDAIYNLVDHLLEKGEAV